MSVTRRTPQRRWVSAEHPAQQPGPPGGTAPREGLTAAPVCCSGWFGTDCTRIRPREPDYRIRAPAATAPRPDGHAGPPPRPLPDEPPDQHRLRPSPPPTTPNALASSLADNYMSATEGQQPVGGGVPNTTLSSRGRGEESKPRRAGLRPRSAAADGSAAAPSAKQTNCQSSWQGSNLRPRAYKARALSTELQEEMTGNGDMPSRIIASSCLWKARLGRQHRNGWMHRPPETISVRQSSCVAPAGRLTNNGRKSSLSMAAYSPQKQHIAFDERATQNLKPPNAPLSLRRGWGADETRRGDMPRR